MRKLEKRDVTQLIFGSGFVNCQQTLCFYPNAPHRQVHMTAGMGQIGGVRGRWFYPHPKANMASCIGPKCQSPLNPTLGDNLVNRGLEVNDQVNGK